jgi:hypothetical protein
MVLRIVTHAAVLISADVQLGLVQRRHPLYPVAQRIAGDGLGAAQGLPGLVRELDHDLAARPGGNVPFQAIAWKDRRHVGQRFASSDIVHLTNTKPNTPRQ